MIIIGVLNKIHSFKKKIKSKKSPLIRVKRRELKSSNIRPHTGEWGAAGALNKIFTFKNIKFWNVFNFPLAERDASKFNGLAGRVKCTALSRFRDTLRLAMPLDPQVTFIFRYILIIRLLYVFAQCACTKYL